VNEGEEVVEEVVGSFSFSFVVRSVVVVGGLNELSFAVIETYFLQD